MNVDTQWVGLGPTYGKSSLVVYLVFTHAESSRRGVQFLSPFCLPACFSQKPMQLGSNLTYNSSTTRGPRGGYRNWVQGHLTSSVCFSVPRRREREAEGVDGAESGKSLVKSECHRSRLAARI